MSATLATPAPEHTRAEEARPAGAPPDEVPEPMAPQVLTAGPPAAAGGDAEFASFGKAILFGILLGIPILGGAVVLALKVLAPSMETAAVIGVALWVALFCGPFLAGTVTVGLSSRKWH